MKKINKKLLVFYITLTFSIALSINYFQIPTVFAQGTSAHIRIVGSTKTIWFGDIETDGCVITDKDGKIHNYIQPFAICILDKAAKQGNITYVVKDFGGSLGLFLEAIAEDQTASDLSTYWLFDVNGQSASQGVSNLLVNSGDSLLFHFINPNADVNQRAINDGLNYLKTQQEDNGQIAGFSGVSAWAAQAYAAAGIDIDTIEENGASLLDYLSHSPPASGSAATDWERAILAITAAGANPYNFSGIDYVAQLGSFYNNSQLGATSQLNDDIFGLLALIAAGSGSSTTIKQEELNFLLAHQNSDGGFSWSTTGTSDVDDTAATLQALVAAQNIGLSAASLADAITKAKDFILASQNTDGGFSYTNGDSSNSATTAWVIMALSSLGLGSDTNVSNAKTYIRGNQEENGSFKWQTSSTGETFTTSYALIALTGKYWPIKIFNSTAPTPTLIPSPTVTPSVFPTVTPTRTPTPTSTPTLSPTPTSSLEPIATVTSIPDSNGGNESLRESVEILKREIRRKLNLLRTELIKQRNIIQTFLRLDRL